MENRYAPKNSQWSARSGVIIDAGGGHLTNGGIVNQNSPFHSPKGGNPSLTSSKNAAQLSGQNVNPSLNMDLPNHMFTQAMNFDNMSEFPGGQGDYGDAVFDGRPRPMANGSHNISDNQMDMYEQQQAKEQAKLLQRFKDLREMQLQQQQMLMLQQQTQLLALKSEQKRVQEIITKQRQNQWGGKVVKAPVSDGSPFISPRKLPIEITDALANGMVAQYHHMHELDGYRNGLPNPAHSQKGLPRPLLPDTDSEGGSHTNPELYSNPGSVDSHFSEDLVPLPRVPSEDGDFIRQPQSHLHSWPPREETAADDDDDDADSDYIQSARSNPPANTWPQREHLHSNPNEGFDTDEGIGTQSFHNSPAAAERVKQVATDNKASPYVCEEELDDDEDTLLNENHEDNHGDINPDDRPVASAITGTKTFEELLEEQLKAEEIKSQQSPSSGNKPTKRPFLRRGQGLERFKAPPRRRETTQPSSKSSGTVKNTDSSASVSSRKMAAPGKSKVSKYSSQPSKTKLDSHKTEPVEKSKKTMPLPKSGHGLPGVAQKSLKLKPQVPKSSNVTNTRIDTSKDNQLDKRKMQESGNSNTEVMAMAIKNQQESTGQQKSAHSDIFEKDSHQKTAANHRRVDSSFFAHLEKMGANQQVEEEDLEEFEMLEHFADNASFSSNSSLVVKVLQKDRLKAAQINGAISQNSAQNQLLYGNKFFPPPSKVLEEQNGMSLPEIDLDEKSSDSSSSDTSDTESEDEVLLSTIKRLDHNSKVHNEEIKENSTQTQGLVRSTDSNNGQDFWKSKNDNSNSDSDGCCKEDASVDISHCGNPSSDIPNSPVKRKIAGRHSAQTASSAYHLDSNAKNHSDSDGLSSSSDEEEEKSCPPFNQSVDKNRNNPSSERNGKQILICEDQFDDEEEWGETSLKLSKEKSDFSDESEANDTLIEEQSNTKQSINDSGTSPSRGSSVKQDVEPSPPPTSKLMSKLFPKLKPQKPAPTQAQIDKLQAAKATPPNDGIQSKLLRDKLAELEAEINKFRAENANLDRLRKEREEGLSKLKKEIADFEKEKNAELQRLTEFKTQEMKKLKHEKKVFEKYQKAVRAMPDKKEREEIETLRTQLSELQEELKRKESRWSLNTTRLKSRVEEVEQENTELKEEIRLLEKKRLEWLQKEQATKALTRPLNGNVVVRSSGLPSDSYQASNGMHYGNSDIEDESESRHDVEKRLGKQPVSNGTSLKVVNKRSEKTSPRGAAKAANQRPKSARPSTNHKPEKTNSPPKPTNQKSKPHSQKLLNSTRISLNEDLPRRQFVSEATPQQAPIASSGSGESQREGPQSRKLAARFNIDKSTIDKGGDYEEVQHPDGKIERIYNSGAREILFSNGTRKEISSDGQSIIVSFFNGDIKQIMADQRVVYYYSEAQTTHSTYPDGLEILQFPNNQVEKHYPDGTKEITFPDQTIKYLFPSGLEESVFVDGTVIRVEKTGDKTIEFPNGQREIHTQQFKKREYPDGTVKTVFPDGRQETRYSNGRIRVKDRDGNVVLDKPS